MARFDGYAPDFRVRINGEELPAAVRSTVSSVSFEDGWNVTDRVVVNFTNPDLRWVQAHIGGLGFPAFSSQVQIGGLSVAVAAPEGLFNVENRLELAVGYAPDPLAEVFVGNVTGVDLTFPNGGVPTLSLVAHDSLQQLAEGTESRGFGQLADAAVAGLLAAEHGLVPEIDATVLAASALKAVRALLSPGSGLKQAGRSGLAVLQSIAQEYDADFSVDGTVLHLSSALREREPRLTLAWGRTLLEFSPRVTTVDQVAEIAARFTLREIPLTFVVSVFWDFERESAGISIVPGDRPSPSNRRRLTLIDRPIRTPLDLAANALRLFRELRQKLDQRLTGSGSAIGDPRIRAGALVRLEGLGPDFSGDYRVKGATHSLDGGGYRTQFEVCKEILP